MNGVTVLKYAVLIAVAVVFVWLVVRSYIKRLNSGCCGTSGDGAVKRVKVADKNKSHYPYTVVMQVDGMVCSNCAARIENSLNSADGVWATADVGNGVVTVRSKSAQDESFLRNTVNNIGAYTVMSIERKDAL